MIVSSDQEFPQGGMRNQLLDQAAVRSSEIGAQGLSSRLPSQEEYFLPKHQAPKKFKQAHSLDIKCLLDYRGFTWRDDGCGS